MTSRESLIDEVYTLRNFLKHSEDENEKLQRELALALDRIRDLEEQLDGHQERKEAPYA